jgi:hypothetical protein
MIEVPFVASAAVETVKFADVAVAATVTDAGTVRVELLLESVTLAPPVGAGWVRVTVQVLKELDPTLPGAQDRVETKIGASRLTVVFAELLL